MSNDGLLRSARELAGEPYKPWGGEALNSGKFATACQAYIPCFLLQAISLL